MATKIKWIAQEIIAEMQNEGRIKVLSSKDTYALDHLLAEGIAPIKKEFERKERASRAYIKAQEEKLLIT